MRGYPVKSMPLQAFQDLFFLLFPFVWEKFSPYLLRVRCVPHLVQAMGTQ